MEHEVVVPMPAATVRQALQDPARLARCVPGLSTEPAVAGSGQAEEISGRLRLRVGASTITFKGVLSLIEGREGVLTAFAEGQEVRGAGEASATVRIAVGDAPAAAGDGSAVVRFTGDLSATGRLSEFEAEALAAAGRRLLDRFAAALASEGAEPGAGEDGAEGGDGSGAEEDGPEEGAEERPDATVLFLEDRAGGGDDGDATSPEGPAGGPDEGFGGGSLDDDLSDLIAFSDDDAERFGLPVPTDDGPPRDGAGPESALPAGASSELPYDREDDPVLSGPVRRSIVGRSAEEVDHAPPRGRYAPALPARSARARAASRWGGESGVSPLGAVAAGRPAVPWVIGGGVALLGGAVVLVRVLRRR